MSGGWHDECVENVVIHLDGSVETVALGRKKVVAVEDGGCAWKALTAPSVVPSAAAVAAGFAAVGGF